MEKDLADDLDDLICSSPNVGLADGEEGGSVLSNVAVLLLTVWFAVALMVYGLANYFLKSDPNPSTAAIAEETIAELSSSGESTVDTLTVEEPLVVEEEVLLQQPIANSNLPKSLGSDEEAVQWINNCVEAIFSSSPVSSTLATLWLDALSNYTKSSGIDDSIFLEFTSLASKSRPQLTNVITQSHPGDNMTVTTDVDVSEVTLAAQLYHRLERDRFDCHNVNFLIDSLKGRLNVAVLSRERLSIAKLDGWPEVKAQVVPGNKKKAIKDEQKELNLKHLCNAALELAISAIRGAQVNINMEEFGGSSNAANHPFPVFVRGFQQQNMGSCSPMKLRPPEPHTKAKILASSPSVRLGSSRKLHICVNKATQIGSVSKKTTNVKPYVIVELDEPGQRVHTDIAPHVTAQHEHEWNQSFTFELTSQSKEVLFEVWDSSQAEAFLGLGIVAVEELLITPNQRHVVPLQGRPYYGKEDEADLVNGLLTVQFLLVDSQETGRKQVVKSQTTTTNGQKTSTETTTFQSDPQFNGKDKVATAALLDLQQRQASRTSTKQMPQKSTLVIHSVQKVPSDGPLVELSNEELKQPNVTSDSSIDYSSPTNAGDRSRVRTKRNLVGTMKKRFTTSASPFGVRGSSDLGQTNGTTDEASSTLPRRGLSRLNDQFNHFIGGLRSISADRASNASTDAEAQYNRAHTYLTVGRHGDEEGSMSDMSAISTASGKTYVAEESSLVLECVEDGITNHYLIPYHLAKRGRFGRKGTKLHVYMDHIFVAKRIKGGTTCEVCLTSIPFRLGKQGYSCRDCSMVCHKPCHIKVPSHCLETSLPNMELQFTDQK